MANDNKFTFINDDQLSDDIRVVEFTTTPADPRDLQWSGQAIVGPLGTSCVWLRSLDAARPVLGWVDCPHPGGSSELGRELSAALAVHDAPNIEADGTRGPVNASRAITEFIVKIESDSQPPSYEEHLAGRLLDKGADVNLRARMLDLAAKWDAVAGDGRDRRSTTLGGCARDLRELAGRPS